LNKSNYDEAKRSANYHVRQAKYEYERSIATNMKEENKIFWKFIQSKAKFKENLLIEESKKIPSNIQLVSESKHKKLHMVRNSMYVMIMVRNSHGT
jgi:hypothetical protein